MIKRTTALCDGKYIGIESIFTVVNGKQINIEEKLKALREKSRANKLYCPCGCGANLVVVASERNLRQQHFRIKDSSKENSCQVVTEGKTSIDSKIVLKCWLDDKIGASDIDSRVSIHALENHDRKYEFTFLSKEKKIAISYCHSSINRTDEKLDIIDENKSGIHVIYIDDRLSAVDNGQFPERLMKVQNKQGYCLLLSVTDNDYHKAVLSVVFYAQDLDGFWKKVVVAEGSLKKFDIDSTGNLLIVGNSLEYFLKKSKDKFTSVLNAEKEKRAEHLRRIKKQVEQLRREAELERQRRIALEKQRRKKEEIQKAEKIKREKEFQENLPELLEQDETHVIDENGVRWIKCEFCGEAKKEDQFVTYKMNKGRCYECDKDPAVQKIVEERLMTKVKYRNAGKNE